MALSQDHDCDLPFQPEGNSRPQFVAARIPRPEVDPAAAQAFGRPAGVQGAFADQHDGILLNDPGATLAQTQPAIQRPAGSVAAVAGRVLPAVVSLEFRVGDQGGFGSGVVIDGHGYVLTNNHVVAPAATIPQATLEAVF